MQMLIFIIYSLIFAIGLVLCLYFPLRLVSSVISDYYGAPYVALPSALVDYIWDQIEISQYQRIYDLGSGDGRVLISFLNRQPAALGVGYEISWYPYLLSRWAVFKHRLGRRLTLARRDFFGQDLSQADLLFIYQTPKLIERLKPKFLAELSPGTLIISPRYSIPGWNVCRELDEGEFPVYMYYPKDQQVKS